MIVSKYQSFLFVNTMRNISKRRIFPLLQSSSYTYIHQRAKSIPLLNQPWAWLALFNGCKWNVGLKDCLEFCIIGVTVYLQCHSYSGLSRLFFSGITVIFFCGALAISHKGTSPLARAPAAAPGTHLRIAPFFSQ